MNYKKYFKSRSLRLKLLRFLSFIPDKPMLMMQYYIKTGRKLNLKNPQRFTEKLQWYKLYYKNPLMIQCVDKYDVREYVKSKGLEYILNECYGIYDKVEDIDFSELHKSFVMKDTLGSGGNSIILVKDKNKVDLCELRNKADNWTKIKAHIRDGGREWPYYSGKNHRIIIEKYIDSDEQGGGLIDYKFVCFNGKLVYLYVVADRIIGNGGGFGFFDENMNKMPVLRTDERPLEKFISKPDNFELLKKISEKLSEDFPEVRVDLYDVNGKIIFGETTFFDGSGYMAFEPDEFDFEIGKKFILNTMNHE